jgi:uncharacterized membrane protein YeiB
MLLCKVRLVRRLTSLLGSARQMAFSDYILQSVICSLVFTPYGLGLYPRPERYPLYYVAGMIWILLLAGEVRSTAMRLHSSPIFQSLLRDLAPGPA